MTSVVSSIGVTAFTGTMALGGKHFVTGMVFGSYGDDTCIGAIKDQDMSVMLATAINPILTVHDILQAKGRAIHLESGATSVYARMGPTSVDTASCGNSSIYVFVNNICVYMNNKHTWENESERDRLSGLVIGQNGRKVNFLMHGLALGSTQALGHQNATGIAPEYGYVPFRSGDSVRVVLLSDTAFDDNVALMTLSADRLSQFAENKRRQEWNGSRFPEQRINANQFDDGSVVVLQNYQG